MTANTTQGGTRKGAGRKTKSPTGERMKTRHIRMTDAQWEACKAIGLDAVRTWMMSQQRMQK